MREAVIVEALRTPIGRGKLGKGELSGLHAGQLLAKVQFGLCKPGEAAAFVADGHLELGGRLPTNTHGGQLSEAYIHGMNGVNEGVRLIRGTSPNQPKKNDHVLVTGGVGVPTSGMILGKIA